MRCKSNYTLFQNFTYGFTLIELLVVISIIALLLSILMPSLQRAKKSAQKVVCTSNHKQIGLGIRLYLTDNSEYYPPHRVLVGGSVLPGEGRISSLERIASYLECGKERRTMFDLWFPQVSREVDYWPAFICPSDKTPFLGINYASSYGISTGLVKSVFVQGWGLNFLDGRNEFIQKLPRSRRALEIKRPSQALVVGDAWWDYILRHGATAESLSVWGLSYRHGRGVDPKKVYGDQNAPSQFSPEELLGIHKGSGVNTLWADGHVEYREYPVPPEHCRVN
jgi:prepilin-type N-terminal cleavage/methylation domain-containing protein/prepilin-type processing-associated H-X9-DG protein